MRRATLLNLLAILTVAGAAPALAAEKVIPAAKPFPFLAAYLKLPPSQRNRFTLSYTLRIGTQPLAAPMWLVEGANRIPVPLGSDGRVQRLPTLAQLENDRLAFGLDESVKLNVALDVEPVTPPTTEIDARDLAAAIAQAAAGQRTVAGVLSMAMPKLQQVGFLGVPSGEVEFGDGRRAALPVIKGIVTYNPQGLPDARRLHFPKPPLKLKIS